LVSRLLGARVASCHDPDVQMTVLAIADLYGISGRRNELVALLAEAERDADEGLGCLRYTFGATLADPDHFVLVSEWRDQAAMDAHYGSPSFASFQFSLEGLLARPSEMTVYAFSGSVRPVASGPMDPRDAD
jgi:quinol monooxygenase YgiN